MRHLCFRTAVRPAHKYFAEFWIVNATRRQVLGVGRQCKLVIHRLQKCGNAWLLAAAGSLEWWLHFIFHLQNQEAVLVRSATPSPSSKHLFWAILLEKGTVQEI